MTTPPYPYKGQQLSKKVMKVLIVELFAGQEEARDVIYKTVYDHHMKRGGKQPDADHPEKNCGRALGELQKEDRAENLQKGEWRIFDKPPPPPEPAKPKKVATKVKPEEVLYEEPGMNQSCYAFYYPAYRELAELKGEEVWPIKIGKTETGESAAQRVDAQSGTNVCEQPVLVFDIRCSSARKTEDFLHEHLNNKGQWKEDAPGQEWFNTNPEQIRAALEFYMGRPSS